MPTMEPPRMPGITEDERLTSEQQSLASNPKHISLAHEVADRYSRKFAPLADEFESASLVALCEAAKTFDASLGATFLGHARTRIVGAMKDVCREWTPCGFRRSREKAPSVVSLSSSVSMDAELDNLSLDETIPADESPVGWEIESLDEVQGLSHRLSPNAGAAIRRLYSHADSSTMKDAGAAIGVSESRISQLNQEAIEDLAHRFPNSEEIFMVGQGLAYSEPKPSEVTVRPKKPENIAHPPSSKAAAKESGDLGQCSKCKSPYGKRKRCYKCVPGGIASKPIHSPSVPQQSRPDPAKAVVVAAQAWGESARNELRAIDEILAIAEKLEPESARRALLWVTERLAKSA